MENKNTVVVTEDQIKGEINTDVNVHILTKDRKLIIDVVPFDDIEMEKMIEDIRENRKIHIELGGRMYDSIYTRQEYHHKVE